MNARYRIAALFVLFGLALSAVVAPAVAAPPKALLIAPGEPYGLPKFGFSGSTIYGYGEQVVDVRFGSRAAQLGLEPGDVILSINGYRLTYSGAWNDGLSRALYNNNFVQLRVRDVHTGNVYTRGIYVDYGYNNGPVQHYSTKSNIVTTQHLDVHPVGPKFKSIQDFKKLTK